MSLFLIIYDRARGAVNIRETFEQDQVAEAVRARFAVEQELAAALGHEGAAQVEVVVLSGESVTELRRTHGRYFASVEELLDVPSDALRIEPRGGAPM